MRSAGTNQEPLCYKCLIQVSTFALASVVLHLLARNIKATLCNFWESGSIKVTRLSLDPATVTPVRGGAFEICYGAEVS